MFILSVRAAKKNIRDESSEKWKRDIPYKPHQKNYERLKGGTIAALRSELLTNWTTLSGNAGTQ